MAHKYLIIFSLVLVFGACVSPNANERPVAPEIVKSMSVDDALDAAVIHGGVTLEKVKRLLVKKGQLAIARSKIEKRIFAERKRGKPRELVNMVHLYQFTGKSLNIQLFKMLVMSERPIVQTLGWGLAANFPGVKVRAEMDRFFSAKLIMGSEKDLYQPGVAIAIQANRLSSAYTLLRAGLFETGDDAFARAMIQLDPKAASNDFLPYLAMADIEDLRQLNQQKVNVYTCMIVLRHLMVAPVSVGHVNFNYIFLYSVSRNHALADLAHEVIRRHLSGNGEQLALILASLPDWVQIAYIEDARRRMSPGIRHFLSLLKDSTQHKSVADEINILR